MSEDNGISEEELRHLRHDLRSPLMVIAGFARLLTSPELSDEKRIDFAGRIENAVAELRKIIDDAIG